MSRLLFATSTEAKALIFGLFQNFPPVLVEVRFPHSGTASDWYLCEVEEQLEKILKRLGSGAELHIGSVWDLENVKGEICLRK
jgi:hypothetical protein